MGWGTYILGGALRGAGEGMLAQLEHDRNAARQLEEAHLRRDRILAALREEVGPEDGAVPGQFASARQPAGDDSRPPRELSLEERWRTAPDTATPGAAALASLAREDDATGGSGPSPDGPAIVRTNRLAVILTNPTAQQIGDIDAALPEGVQLRRREDGGYSAPRKYEGVVHGVLNAGEQPAATGDPTDGIVVNRDAVRAALDRLPSQSAGLTIDGPGVQDVVDDDARNLGKQVFAQAKGDPDLANALLAGTFGPTMSEAAKSGSDATFDASFSGGDESGNRLKAVYGPVGDSWTDDLRSFGRYVIDKSAKADPHGAIPFRWQENEAVMRQVNIARAEFERELLRAGLAPVDVGVGAYNIGTGNGTARDWLVVGGTAAGPFLSNAGAIVLPLVSRAGKVTAGSEFVGPLIGTSGFRTSAEFAEVVGTKYQALVDETYVTGQLLDARGLLHGHPNFRLGNYVDRMSLARLHKYLKIEGISEGPGTLIQLDRYLRDPAGSGRYVRPDLRIPAARRIFDGTLGFKHPGSTQISRFGQYSGGDYITVIRPGSLGGSYSIVP